MHGDIYSPYEDETNQHINRVGELIDDITGNLWKRANVHDESKLKEPERSGFERLKIRLGNAEYGTDHYQAALDESLPVREHHYAVNSHHPEHYPNGVSDMSLMDILEMLADWKASGERTLNGSLKKSLEFNRKRFDLSDELYGILVTTAIELGWYEQE
jgi:hypothetical protein